MSSHYTVFPLSYYLDFQ